ncbi:MAG: flippase-like domain-containing protein [Cellulomonas sp.]|nr:flippase-like domain-containing protein [Cellulomonas sp.]
MLGIGLLAVVVALAEELPDMIHAVRNGNPVWAGVAVLFAASGFFTAALSLRACSPRPLPFRRTVRVQLATSFTGTVTPASVGSLALNVRYLSTQGLDPALATGTVALQAVVQSTTHIGMLALLLAFGARSESLTREPGWERWALAGVVVLLVASGIVYLSSQRLRTRLTTLFRDQVLPAVRHLSSLLTDPRRLAQAVAGAAGTTASAALTMWACLIAFGQPSRPVAAAFTTMVAGSVASAAPTPGGVGAVEAALTAGLVGFGVPTAVALPTVLFYRVVTTWIPVLIGSFQLRALTRTGAV